MKFSHWILICLILLLSSNNLVIADETEIVDDSSSNNTSGNSSSQSCEDDEDCGSMHVCNESNECVRKTIFPITLQELIGSFLIMIVVGAGQAAGIGGGLVVTPLLMTFFYYGTKKSIAIVFITIVSASVVNLITFAKQKGTDGEPLINYKIVLLSLPTILCGSLFGVMFNKFLPQAVIFAMLVFFIVQSLTKMVPNYKKEKLKEEQERAAAAAVNQGTQLADLNSPLIPQVNSNNSRHVDSDEEKERQYPKAILQKIVCIAVAFLVFSLLRGGSKFPSIIDIPACGFMYHFCNLALLGCAFLFVKGLIAGLVVAEQFEKKVSLASSNAKTLTAQEMQKFANSAFMAGLIGAIVGIGGGMILIPRWLESGISPSRTTPCSIALLFLTAINSVVQFSLAGVFTLEEFIFFCVVSLLSSLFVSSSIQAYVKRTNQRSLLFLILVIFMSTALVLFSAMNYKKATEDLGQLLEFGQFC